MDRTWNQYQKMRAYFRITLSKMLQGRENLEDNEWESLRTTSTITPLWFQHIPWGSIRAPHFQKLPHRKAGALFCVQQPAALYLIEDP